MLKLCLKRTKLKRMATKEKIYTQHHENEDWINKLDFYKEELNILKGRLEELALKNTSKKVTLEIEHFQNQFIIQNNNIDNIAHAVKINESELIASIESNPVAAAHRKIEYHEREHDLVTTFEKNFKQLRKDFNNFSSKWM
jgi:hypothetical protein